MKNSYTFAKFVIESVALCYFKIRHTKMVLFINDYYYPQFELYGDIRKWIFTLPCLVIRGKGVKLNFSEIFTPSII